MARQPVPPRSSCTPVSRERAAPILQFSDHAAGVDVGLQGCHFGTCSPLGKRKTQPISLRVPLLRLPFVVYLLLPVPASVNNHIIINLDRADRPSPSMEKKPIPAFYCCYLLRSKSRKSYYIGSTPNPARRLGQHNGSSKGGAKRTSMQGNRPWEMTCIVTGFTSRYAALQFEWAWQHTHLTRHIEKGVRDARIEELQKKKKPKKSPGKKPKNPPKNPPMSLEARLKNLHYLLGVKSFDRWPLHVRFFAPDVSAAWEKHTAKMTPKLRMGVLVQLTPVELPAPAPATAGEGQTFKIPEIIRAIPVAYEDSKAHVEKTKLMFDDGLSRSCGICRAKVDPAASLVLVCPLQTCRTICHMGCLSSRFLAEEGRRDSLMPLEGTCPGCLTPIKWTTLMKELSLRTRGQEEIEAMFKPKRRKKADSVSEPESALPQELGEKDEDLDETWMEGVDDEDEPPEPNVA